MPSSDPIELLAEVVQEKRLSMWRASSRVNCRTVGVQASPLRVGSAKTAGIGDGKYL